MNVVAANGSLTPSFAIPATKTIRPYYLAVTPDRVVGGDARDGSPSVPVWSRTVSSSGFGAETSLPVRASALSASAGRTAIMGQTGVSVYDRGSLQHTFTGDQADLSDVQLSGPYVVERLVDANNDAYTKVSKADGSQTQQFTGWPSGVFGSQYVSTSVDALQTGSIHVVVRDLTGAPNALYTLPTGTADCYAMGVWGSTIALYRSVDPQANATQIYNYKTGTLLGSTPGLAESLGDGYAVVNTGSTYSVWNIAANTLLTGCNSSNAIEATDGVGHVACGSNTDLIWQDYSSVSTSAPRLLGILADDSASFSEPGSTWSLAMDTTKALAAGSVVISNASGTQVRSLTTPASADGSVRVT